MTLSQLLVHIATYIQDHPEQRKGQAWFNAVWSVEPEVANLYRGTDIDPFYNDALIDSFRNAISAWFV